METRRHAQEVLPEESDQCRVCRLESSADSPLYYPCRCKGTIKWIHQECLVTWLKHSHITRCELCRHPFDFHPLYAPDSPPESSMSIATVIFWIIQQSKSFWPRIFRWFIVFVTWICFIPLSTFLIFRFFVSNFSLEFLPSSYLDVFAHCRFGLFICSIILLITLIWALFKDLCRLQLRDADGDDLPLDEDDAGEDVHMNVGLRELDDGEVSKWIGLNGSFINFGRNVFMVFMYNFAFLFITILVPLSFGRFSMWLFHLDASTLSWEAFMSASNLWGSKHLDIEQIRGDCLDQEACLETNPEIAAIFARYQFIHLFFIVTGYSCFAICGIAMFLYETMKSRESRILPFIRKIRSVASKTASVLMVAFCLCLELVIIPILLGIAIDFGTLDIRLLSVNSVLQFLEHHPIVFFVIRWLSGVLFLMTLNFIVSCLRTVVRHRILAKFIRNPDDRQELTDLFNVKYCFMILVHIVVFAILVFLLIHIPAKIIARTVPSILPISFRLYEPGEMHLDFVLLHFAIPYVFDRLNLWPNCERLIKFWLLNVSSFFSLRGYLIEPTGNAPNAVAPIAAQIPNPEPNLAMDENAEELFSSSPTPDDDRREDAANSAVDSDMINAASPVSSPRWSLLDFEEEKIPDDPPSLSLIGDSDSSATNHQHDQHEYDEFVSEHDRGSGPRDRPLTSQTGCADVIPTPLVTSLHDDAQARHDDAPADDAPARHDDDELKIPNHCDDPQLITVQEIPSNSVLSLMEHDDIDLNSFQPMDEQFNLIPPIDERTNQSSIDHFALRVFFLLLSTWIAYLGFVIVVTLMPLLTGRYVLSVFRPPLNGFRAYEFLCGMYIILGSGWICTRIFRIFFSDELFDRFSLMRKWFKKIGRISFVAVFFVVLFPLLAGVLARFIVITPIYLGLNNDDSWLAVRCEDWVLGLLILRISAKGVLIGAFGECSLQNHLEKIKRDGIENMDIRYISKHIVSFLVRIYLVHLVTPYLFSRWVLPTFLTNVSVGQFEILAQFTHFDLGNLINSLEVHASLINQTIYLFVFVVRVVFTALLWILRSYSRLKKKIFAEKYVVGTQLRNCSFDQPKPLPTN